MKVHIIGGGIIGLSTAYHLSNHCEVVVYEKDNSYNLAVLRAVVVVLEVSSLHQSMLI